MADEAFNDNNAADNRTGRREPDPNGQAAILLVESLIHSLIARSVMSVTEAVEVVDVAVAVSKEIADDHGDAPGTLVQSQSILAAISASLRLDTPQR